MIFIHIVSLICIALLLHMQPLLCQSLKPVGNRGEREVKLPDPTGPLTEELPPLVISAANQGIIESSKK